MEQNCFTQSPLYFAIPVGPSVDPAGVTMVDSIKVYGKTKENFGWPDDPPDDFPSTTGASNLPATSNTVAPSTETEAVVIPTPVSLSSLDRLVASSLEVLDGFVCLISMEDKVITSSYIAQFTITKSMRFTIVPWSFGQ